MERDTGKEYRWNAELDLEKQMRERLVKDAEAKLPSGTRYELRLEPKQSSPIWEHHGERAMSWRRTVVMDAADDWQPGHFYRDGTRVERRVVPPSPPTQRSRMNRPDRRIACDRLP